jgi:hypothetical protein
MARPTRNIAAEETGSRPWWIAFALAAGCGGAEPTVAPDATDMTDMTVTCSAAQTRCDNKCADLQRDPDHCGACGYPCPGGTRCEAGRCGAPLDGGLPLQDAPCAPGIPGCAAPDGPTGDAPSRVCPTGTVDCGRVCADLSSDPAHCGTCPTHCPPGGGCNRGVCFGGDSGVTCPPGRIDCNGFCADPQTDPRHCGACPTICPLGIDCNGGVCGRMTCPAGRANCSGFCSDLTTDPSHCGTCDRRCRSSVSCVAGVCNERDR